MTFDAGTAQSLGRLARVSREGGLDAKARRRLKQLSSRLEGSADQEGSLASEPIRTLHHFSCTGGTLFAKCIASLANMLVLNEVDPFSRMQAPEGKARFTPTDMVALVRQGDRQTSDSLMAELFLAEIDVLRTKCWRTDRKLLLRDHTHSHFLHQELDEDRRTLCEVVADRFPLRSLVTVRHPVDSYLSMRKQGWHLHFSPSHFDEYCRRYLQFLKKYSGVPIVKFEDFASSPTETMKQIAEIYDLEYSDLFLEAFSVFEFSGDSGRKKERISVPPRREIPANFLTEVAGSTHFPILIERLKYTK